MSCMLAQLDSGSKLRSLVSGEKQPTASEANKMMTLAKFALALLDHGLDWGPHTQLRGPNSVAVIEVLASLHLPHPRDHECRSKKTDQKPEVGWPKNFLFSA